MVQLGIRPRRGDIHTKYYVYKCSGECIIHALGGSIPFTALKYAPVYRSIIPKGLADIDYHPQHILYYIIILTTLLVFCRYRRFFNSL